MNETATRSVLVVDDAVEFRALIGDILDESDVFSVVGEAQDGMAGVALAAELQPDVILLDISMPRMDGLEALPKLIEVAPDSKIVILTGFGGERLRDPALARGATGYIEKGAPAQQLVSRLIEALGG